MQISDESYYIFKIKVRSALSTLIFVNEFVKWPRPLNSIGRLKLGHPGWQLFKLMAKRQQEKQMSLGKDSSVQKSFRIFLQNLVLYTLYLD